MNKYVMVIDYDITATQWSHEFETGNKDMATNYAHRRIRQDNTILPGATINLFDIEADRLIATYHVSKTVVETIV